MSICAQSCASVPPAPALISSCASRKSSGPDSSERRRNASISSATACDFAHRARDAISSSGSGASMSSSSCALVTRAARSRRTARSSPSAPSPAARPPAPSAGRSRSPARPSALRAPSACRRLASTSKIPPQLGESLGVLRASCRVRSVSAMCVSLGTYDTSRPRDRRTARA